MQMLSKQIIFRLMINQAKIEHPSLQFTFYPSIYFGTLEIQVLVVRYIAALENLSVGGEVNGSRMN
jgi:hypothetical protein